MAGKIASIRPRMILDSRGNPTVEVDLVLDDGSFGRAAVPSGASTGAREALELRDNESAFGGKGVTKALRSITEQIAPQLIGKSWEQATLDETLQQLDGSEGYTKLGANAALPVSMAFAVATAYQKRVPLYRLLGELSGNTNFTLPRPMWNIMNGGAHANWTTDIQEYMIQGVHLDQPFVDQVRVAVEIYQSLGKVLISRNLSVQVGNEGGYAPDLESNTQALELILEAITKAGYKAGPDGDVVLALDVAASEFFDKERYSLRRDGVVLSSVEMSAWLEKLISTYPITSIEDGFAESDWSGWQNFTAKHGNKLQIVSDDLLVTNASLVSQAVEKKACNALLVKLNQIGTLSQTFTAMQTARAAGWSSIPSHRSGETEDVFIAHLAVGTGAGQIKTGAPSRTDRTAKYNELLRISETL